MEKISTDQLHTGYWSVLSSKSKFLLPMNVFMLTFRYKLVLSYEAHFFSKPCWFFKYFSTDQWLGSTKFLSYFDIFLYKYVIVFPETNILRILVNDNKWRHMIMARRQYWPATGQYRKLGMGSVIDGKFSVYQEYNTGMHKNIKFYEILKLWLFQLGTFPCKVTYPVFSKSGGQLIVLQLLAPHQTLLLY